MLVYWRVTIAPRGIEAKSPRQRQQQVAAHCSLANWVKRKESCGLSTQNSWDLEEFKLVGGWATPLKNMKVSWDDYIPNWMVK